MVHQAGIRPTDETYDLFIAIAALPDALKKTVAVLCFASALVVLSVASLVYMTRTSDGITRLPNARGHVFMISKGKGIEQVQCPDAEYLCLQVIR